MHLQLLKGVTDRDETLIWTDTRLDPLEIQKTALRFCAHFQSTAKRAPNSQVYVVLQFHTKKHPNLVYCKSSSIVI